MTAPAPSGAALGDLQASLLRTLTPVVVGTLLGGLLRHRIGDDDAKVLSEVIEPAAIVGYYALVRVLERRFGRGFGWLLGYARAPGYLRAATHAAPEPAVAANPEVGLDARAGLTLAGLRIAGLESMTWEQAPDGPRRLTLVLQDPEVVLTLPTTDGAPAPPPTSRRRRVDAGSASTTEDRRPVAPPDPVRPA